MLKYCVRLIYCCIPYTPGEFPLSRYVTTNSLLNVETILIFQLASYFGANYQDNITHYMKCSECYEAFNNSDEVYMHIVATVHPLLRYFCMTASKILRKVGHHFVLDTIWLKPNNRMR